MHSIQKYETRIADCSYRRMWCIYIALHCTAAVYWQGISVNYSRLLHTIDSAFNDSRPPEYRPHTSLTRHSLRPISRRCLCREVVLAISNKDLVDTSNIISARSQHEDQQLARWDHHVTRHVAYWFAKWRSWLPFNWTQWPYWWRHCYDQGIVMVWTCLLRLLLPRSAEFGEARCFNAIRRNWPIYSHDLFYLFENTRIMR